MNSTAHHGEMGLLRLKEYHKSRLLRQMGKLFQCNVTQFLPSI